MSSLVAWAEMLGSGGPALALKSSGVLRVGPVEIDTAGHIVRVGDQDIALTLTEFRLLAHMARSPTRVFARGELVDACMPGSDALDRTVDSHVSKLRRKLQQAGAPNMPEGVRGVGSAYSSTIRTSSRIRRGRLPPVRPRRAIRRWLRSRPVCRSRDIPGPWRQRYIPPRPCAISIRDHAFPGHTVGAGPHWSGTTCLTAPSPQFA